MLFYLKDFPAKSVSFTVVKAIFKLTQNPLLIDITGSEVWLLGDKAQNKFIIDELYANTMQGDHFFGIIMSCLSADSSICQWKTAFYSHHRIPKLSSRPQWLTAPASFGGGYSDGLSPFFNVKTMDTSVTSLLYFNKSLDTCNVLVRIVSAFFHLHHFLLLLLIYPPLLPLILSPLPLPSPPPKTTTA